MTATRWVVLRTDWFQCIEAAVPFLMRPGDSVRLVEPTFYTGPEHGTRDVVMAPHRAPELAPVFERHAADVVLYETENLLGAPGWRARSEALRRQCPSVRWWNYSRINAQVFGDVWKPLQQRGFAWPPGLTAPRRDGPDVLFVGSLNTRRLRVLRELEGAGLRVFWPNQPTFGRRLAELERSARLVLNVHYYEPGVFESFRVVPAVHRSARVLSEVSEGNEGADWCECVPYRALVPRTLEILKGAEK